MGIFIDDMDLMNMAIGVFWTLLFLQSSLDKILDWGGNLNWLKSHFEKSILAGIVPLMLWILTLMEFIAGILCAVGVVQVVCTGKTYYLSMGLVASIVSLLMLFFGQRLAKDYEGARTIAIYFGVALISVMILSK